MILSLQYLRGLAALMVLLSHAAWKGQQYAGDPLSWFRIGHAGVDIFFVISGFVMCHTTRAEPGREVAIGRFMAHRFGRILPLYWLLSLLALAVFWTHPQVVNSGADRTDVWQSFLLWPSDGSYLIQAGWTLSYELFFYALFALGMLLPRAAWGHLAVCLALATLFLLGRAMELGWWPCQDCGTVGVRFATDAILLNFIYGIALYHLHRRQVLSARWAWGMLALAVLGFVACNQEWLHWRWRSFRYGLPALALCWALLAWEPALRRVPSRILTELGDASYSVYLVHPFALALGALVLHKLGWDRSGWVFVPLIVGGAVCAGVLCYRWVELPLTRRVRVRIEAALASVGTASATSSGDRA
jgi:exopolysaccharide production protein ExoZ